MAIVLVDVHIVLVLWWTYCPVSYLGHIVFTYLFAWFNSLARFSVRYMAIVLVDVHIALILSWIYCTVSYLGQMVFTCYFMTRLYLSQILLTCLFDKLNFSSFFSMPRAISFGYLVYTDFISHWFRTGAHLEQLYIYF